MLDKLRYYKQQIKENKIFFFLIGFMFLYFISLCCFLNDDFYLTAVDGRWMIENKSIRYINDGFILEGYETVIQQWLYCILLYLSYCFHGEIGVAIFTILQFCLLIFTTYKLLQTFNINKKTSLLVMVIAFMGIKGYFNCRPEMISLILLELQLIVTEKYRQNENKKILYFLPLITLLEINLHGTYWVFHFIFLLPYIFPWDKVYKFLFKKTSNIIDNSINIKKLKDFIFPVVLMIVSLFINPYGYKMITCLFNSSEITDLGIGEMALITIVSEPIIYIISSIIVAVIIYNKKQLTSVTFLFTMGLTLIELLAWRNIMFFLFVTIFLAKDFLKETNIEIFFQAFSSVKLNIVLKIFAIVFPLLVFLTQIINLILPTEDISKMAFDYIDNNEENISDLNLYSTYNYGSHFLWYGIGHVYIHTKTEPYIEQINGKKNIISEYLYITTYADADKLQEFLDTYDFDYLFVDYHDQALEVYLETNDNYECVLIGNTIVSDNEDEYIEYYLYKKID